MKAFCHQRTGPAAAAMESDEVRVRIAVSGSIPVHMGGVP